MTERNTSPANPAARLIRSFLAIVVFFWAAAAPAHAQETLRGVALVIGNGAYQHLAPLANPPDDADAIEALLADLGFDSVRRTDRDARDLARDLERFVEDAEGADVAVLYYAGHGVEAGGENFLIPVDADISALDAAAEKLVPVSDVIRRLRDAVPVTIVLLDACRDNPFPPDATLRLAAGADPLPVSAGGLSEPARGAAPLRVVPGNADANPENFGIVVGFAAAPGEVALDGAAGENSPYAAALTRHISAMGGEEFGTVMRMVAEEVYLRTAGAQRPWVNESLRRLLYFGEAPEPVAGPEGEILTERRSLLLTISVLPDVSRRQVERIAGRGGVPMDAVYGMLKVLGKEAPDDPVELEKLLREQTGELRAFLADRRVIDNPDPELARLSALSDQAVAEGAIETANRLRREVDRRIGELSAVIGREEDLIRARRGEFAAEYARSAEISRLAFDYKAAAADYAKAYDQIERWDDRLAWHYRKKQIEELLSHNRLRGDPQSVERATALARDLLALAARIGDVELGGAYLTLSRARYVQAHVGRDIRGYFEALEDVEAALELLSGGETRAEALTQRGFILGSIAANHGQPERFAEAVASYRAALIEIGREEHPQLWYELNSELGNLLAQIATHTIDPAPMREAVALFEEAMDFAGDADPVNRMLFQLQLAVFRIALPRLEDPEGVDLETADALIAELEAARADTILDQFPLALGLFDHAIGLMQMTKANFSGGSAALAQAIGSFRSALQYRRRDIAPGEWAETSEQLAFALRRRAAEMADPAEYRAAVAAFGDALTVYRPTGALQRWAPLQQGLIGATRELAALDGDLDGIAAAAAIARRTLAEPVVADAPGLRFDFSRELGWTLWDMHQAGGGLEPLREQVAVLEAALPGVDPDERTDDYREALFAIGDAAQQLGASASDTGWLRRAAAAYERGIGMLDAAERRRIGAISYDTGNIYIAIGDRDRDMAALDKALHHFGEAVDHIDPAEQPVAHAHAISDRATVHHRRLLENKDAESFERAHAGYLEVIPIYEKHSQASLGLHLRNLGLLYLARDDQTGTLDRHEAAADVFRRAVEANRAAGAHGELFRAAHKLGDVLVALGRDRRQPDRLRQAVAAYRQATGVSAADASPPAWAEAQHRLGYTLHDLALIDNDVARLAEAQTAYRAALEIRTPDADFSGWFTTMASLAETQAEQARRGDGVAQLETALAAYETLIARYPAEWTVKGAADLRVKRANMLRMIGDRGGGAGALAAAAAGYGEALAMARGEDAPEFHVGVGRNLGDTLGRLAAATGDMAVHRQSAEAYRAALRAIPEGGDAAAAALARRDIGRALTAVGETLADTAILDDAIAALASAETFYDRDAYPLDWAYNANNRAWADIVAGRADGDAARFERAASALREVVALQRGIGDTANLGYSQDSLCAALYELGAARGAKSLLEEARQACRSAIAVLRENGRDAVADNTAKLLARVEAAAE